MTSHVIRTKGHSLLLTNQNSISHEDRIVMPTSKHDQYKTSYMTRGLSIFSEFIEENSSHNFGCNFRLV